MDRDELPDTIRRSVLKAVGAGIILSGSSTSTSAQPATGYHSVNLESLSGSGKESDPFLITDVNELQAISEDLTAHYKIENDIDASGTASWNETTDISDDDLGSANDTSFVLFFSPIVEGSEQLSAGEETISAEEYELDATTGEVTFESEPGGSDQRLTADYELPEPATLGFDPIGNSNERFTGHLDGGGHSIQGLSISRPHERPVGLVSELRSGTIENLELSDVDIRGGSQTGAVVGVNHGAVQNVDVSGSVGATGNDVGGVIGINEDREFDGEKGEIYHSVASCDVSGGSFTGGLVGKSRGVVKRSASAGSVEGDSGVIGGLVGFNSGGEISYCTASGVVVGGGDFIGGLVGDSFQGELRSVYATSSVSGENFIGGLVGLAAGGQVDEGVATGDVTGDTTGGLIGYNSDTPTSQSYWDVDASGQQDAIGVDQSNESDIDVTGLSTADMVGHMAEENMSALDFEDDWQTVATGDEINGVTPAGEGYPILSDIDTTRQLNAQGIAYEAVEFVIEITSPDDGEEVTEEEALDVVVKVENTGTGEAEKTIELIEPIEDDEDVQLEADETDEVTFEIPGDEVVGEFHISVESPSDMNQVTVTVTDPCFIATAAYDTPTASEIDILRDFRDDVLQQNALGRLLIKTYYWGSPPIARWIRRNRTRRELVKQYFVEPLVTVVENRNDIWRRE